MDGILCIGGMFGCLEALLGQFGKSGDGKAGIDDKQRGRKRYIRVGHKLGKDFLHLQGKGKDSIPGSHNKEVIAS